MAFLDNGNVGIAPPFWLTFCKKSWPKERGIGTTAPGGTLDVAAGKTTLADAWTVRSSIRWKENIQPINNSLDKIMKLRGVYFDWKQSGKHDLGMIAEEVGKIIPEVVVYEENGKDAKALDYDHLVAVLVEAIKELKAENDTLKARIEALEAKLNRGVR